MGDISATSLQSTSNDLLTDNNKPKVLLLDKPLVDQNISLVGPPSDIAVPQQNTKTNKEVQKFEQKVFDQEQDTVPVRPVRRKDSLTPGGVHKSDDLTTELANDFTPSCGIKEGHSSVLQKITAYTDDHKHKQEAESVQIPTDVAPPDMKKIDGSLPTETQKTAPCKPLRRKDKTIEHPDSAFQQIDTESVCSKEREQTSCSEECPKKHSTSVKASSHVILPFKTTKGTKIMTSKPEPEKSNVEQTASLSIIKKISLPHRGKKLFSSKSGKVDTDKGITAQNAVTNRESVKPVQINNTATGDMHKIEHPVVASDKSVETINITSSQKSEDAPEIAERDKQPTHPIPRPRVRKRISGSFPDDFTATDSTPQAFHREDAQSAKQAGPSTTTELSVAQECKDFPLPHLGDQPSTSEEAMLTVPLMRSRLTIDNNIQPEDVDTSEKTLTCSNLPVPKPRVKKRLSDSFPYDVTISGSSPPLQPDTVADNLHTETVQQNEQSGLPDALPQAKNHRNATNSDSTPDNLLEDNKDSEPDNLFHLEVELSQSNPEDATVTSKETKKGSASLDFNVISEGGFVTVQGEDDVTSELEQEVLAAMQEEERSQPDSTESALDEIIKEWTFTDKHVVKDEPEKATEMVSEQANMEKASSQDDWLHVEDNEESEPMEINVRKEMRDEDVDFDFVSVVVTAGCLEDQR